MNHEIKFFCVHCGQSIAADSSVAGKHVVCPSCDQGFTVPTPAVSTPSPLPQPRLTAGSASVASPSVLARIPARAWLWTLGVTFAGIVLLAIITSSHNGSVFTSSRNSRNREFLVALLDTVARYSSTKDNFGWDRRIAAISAAGVSDQELISLQQAYAEAYKSFERALFSGISSPPETQRQAVGSLFDGASTIGDLGDRADRIAQKYGISRTGK